MKSKKNKKQHILVLAALVLFAAVFAVMLRHEKQAKKPEPVGDYRGRYQFDTLLEYNGKSYRQKKNQTVILVMGIDRDTDAPVEGFRDGGQADFLRLIALDNAAGVIKQLAIDRDTMTPITILGVLGDVSGERVSQISLSHGFGDGREQSCEFTVNAVSKLLAGTKIDHYLAMNLDGIAVLNDYVGGVTLTLLDDFSSLKPGMVKGTAVTLHGEEAEVYVRNRMNVEKGTNEARMERQQQYIAALTDLLVPKLRMGGQESIGELYDLLEPYTVTDLSRGEVINSAWAAQGYEKAEAVSIPGQHRRPDDSFVQFYPDEERMMEILLELLYEEIR